MVQDKQEWPGSTRIEAECKNSPDGGARTTKF